MSFADDVSDHERQSRKPNPCKTGIWITGLNDRDRDAFRDFLARGGSAADLHKLAIKNGCEAGETQFRRHCRERCSCYLGVGIVE